MHAHPPGRKNSRTRMHALPPAPCRKNSRSRSKKYPANFIKNFCQKFFGCTAPHPPWQKKFARTPSPPSSHPAEKTRAQAPPPPCACARARQIHGGGRGGAIGRGKSYHGLLIIYIVKEKNCLKGAGGANNRLEAGKICANAGSIPPSPPPPPNCHSGHKAWRYEQENGSRSVLGVHGPTSGEGS